MIEVNFGVRSVDLPYTIHVPGVTEEMFDELVDEDTRAELIDGVMIVHSPAALRHDDISGFLRPLMRCFAEQKKLGKVLGPDGLFRPRKGRRFGPDLFFLEQTRVPSPLPKVFQGAPDMLAEVLSPSNRPEDVAVKLPAYRRAGIREIWLVDPDRQEITVYRRRGRRYTARTTGSGRVRSDVLPGFWIESDWLWSEPLPDLLPCLREILGDHQ
jgi:Uma2 family endonuclease